MHSMDVIARAPLLGGFASTLLVAAQYTTGPVSAAFNTAALVVASMTLGALLTHFPNSVPDAVSDEGGQQ